MRWGLGIFGKTGLRQVLLVIVKMVTPACLRLDTLSMKITNRIGDKVQPWQRPILTRKMSDLLPKPPHSFHSGRTAIRLP